MVIDREPEKYSIETETEMLISEPLNKVIPHEAEAMIKAGEQLTLMNDEKHLFSWTSIFFLGSDITDLRMAFTQEM